MAAGFIEKLFFHNRYFEYPIHRVRFHSGVDHAVRAPGDIRNLDSDQEILEDVAVLAGHWLLVTGFLLLATGCWLLVAEAAQFDRQRSYKLQGMGYKVEDAGRMHARI
jgi:hypothetical protein